jgi:hypothetical protein
MIVRPHGVRAVVCLLAGLATASCAASLMTLPEGPGVPAPDGRDALVEATSVCRAVASLTAEASVSGSVGGRRLRARLSIGAQSPASARLEAIGPFANPVFILAARGDTATLLLNEDNRILKGARPEAVLEALTGVPLDAARLREALTGCSSLAALAGEARQLGPDWRVLQDGPETRIYVQRVQARMTWQLVAAVHRAGAADEWRAEYREFTDGLPRALRFASRVRDRFDLRLQLADIEVNPPLPPEAFEIRIPANAQPITLDELRRAGPLSDDAP